MGEILLCSAPCPPCVLTDHSRYVPSVVICALALALFAIALILHTWLLFKYRTWYFIPVTIGLLMELVGYVSRTLSSQKNPYAVIFFVIQYFFIVVAPVMFSVSHTVTLYPCLLIHLSLHLN